MSLHYSDLFVISGLLAQLSQREADHNTAKARLAWNLSQKIKAEANLQLEEAK